jgi:hypothetical protein
MRYGFDVELLVAPDEQVIEKLVQVFFARGIPFLFSGLHDALDRAGTHEFVDAVSSDEARLAGVHPVDVLPRLGRGKNFAELLCVKWLGVLRYHYIMPFPVTRPAVFIDKNICFLKFSCYFCY